MQAGEVVAGLGRGQGLRCVVPNNKEGGGFT